MIVVKNLWKAYGPKEILKGLSLEVPTGKTLVILGRSGVGKSVLLRQIMGLEEPDQGSIEIDGEAVHLLQPGKTKLPKRVGMLFQGGALFDSMTVGENIGFYLAQHGDPETGEELPEEEITRRVQEALQKVNLENVEEKMPSELSGGMRKRAALARLLAYRPVIVLYDEPTTGLDPITSMQINQLIKTVQKELNATSIVVTHDICSAYFVGDFFAMHHDGKIAAFFDRDHFFSCPHTLVQSFLQDALLKKNEETLS